MNIASRNAALNIATICLGNDPIAMSIIQLLYSTLLHSIHNKCLL